jgi:hypothetical protein
MNDSQLSRKYIYTKIVMFWLNFLLLVNIISVNSERTYYNTYQVSKPYTSTQINYGAVLEITDNNRHSNTQTWFNKRTVAFQNVPNIQRRHVEIYIDFVTPNDAAAPRPRARKYAIMVPAVSAYLLSTILKIREGFSYWWFHTNAKDTGTRGHSRCVVYTGHIPKFVILQI